MDIAKMRQNRWLRLAIFLVSLIAISFGLAYALQGLFSHFQLVPDRFFLLAYIFVFGTTLLANATIIAPVPVALAIMIAAATRWDPLLISFAASVGGALGELSGYYVGYLGKKIASIEGMAGYERIASWMNRYGVWAIFLLALQPVLPFDVAGIISGSAKMPLYKFLPTLWGGKFIKYALICYSGVGLIHFMPFWSP
jgi:membrane protein YqaA with SNARE-associated domain